MTDDQLFRQAAYWARQRAGALGTAAAIGANDRAGRQCLQLARKAEWRVIELAIQAELRAGRAVGGVGGVAA